MPTFELRCLFVRGAYFHGVLINFLVASIYVGTVIYFRPKGSLVPRPPLFYFSICIHNNSRSKRPAKNMEGLGAFIT